MNMGTVNAQKTTKTSQLVLKYERFTKIQIINMSFVEFKRKCSWEENAPYVTQYIQYAGLT